MNKKHKQNLISFLDGANDILEGLPDGAWWQAMEDMVAEFNESNGTSFDTNDGVHMRVKRRGERV